MKKLFTISLLVIAYSYSWGTSQIPDILIYKGDTLYLCTDVMGLYPNQSALTTKSLFGVKDLFKTSCYNGFVATWKIEDHKLYLVEIKNGVDENGEYSKKYADLKSIFKEKYKNGKVLADWYTGSLFTQQGKVLAYTNEDPVGCICEKEIYFKIKKGKSFGTTTYDNTKTRTGKFPSDSMALRNYVDSAVDYSRLPKLNHQIIVYVEILNSNKNGEITKMKILKGYNKVFNNEAIRVLMSLKGWDHLYKHGKPYFIRWTFPVRFFSNTCR